MTKGERVHKDRGRKTKMVKRQKTKGERNMTKKGDKLKFLSTQVGGASS